MELLVDAGLTPMQAIEAATATGAAFLGRAGDLGTIEPGKLADLIVLTGNPAPADLGDPHRRACPGRRRLGGCGKVPEGLRGIASNQRQRYASSNPSSESVLNRVGRYEITEKLGQGGMGTVYKAFDPIAAVSGTPILTPTRRNGQGDRRRLSAKSDLSGDFAGGGAPAARPVRCRARIESPRRWEPCRSL